MRLQQRSAVSRSEVAEQQFELAITGLPVASQPASGQVRKPAERSRNRAIRIDRVVAQRCGSFPEQPPLGSHQYRLGNGLGEQRQALIADLCQRARQFTVTALPK